jgi:catechol 2,3-dioxygenase-like lactoylglutathione lyase family enzyme
MMYRIFAVGAAMALGGCTISNAAVTSAPQAPVNTSPGVETPAERVPTDMRRTTIITRNIENSLRLYRDVIGLRVNYDTVVTMSGVALPAGQPGARARLVLLNGNDPFIGWIGLMEWIDPPLADPGPYPRRMGPGGVVLVTNTDDVDGRCAAAARVPGVVMTSEPRLQEYPGRNGGPPIRVRGCNFFDPDGILVEMNQLLR